MLTDYLVSCPHCHWYGSLFARGDREAWRMAFPPAREVTFDCPQCHGEWRARVVGDDVKPLPVSAEAVAAS